MSNGPEKVDVALKILLVLLLALEEDAMVALTVASLVILLEIVVLLPEEEIVEEIAIVEVEVLEIVLLAPQEIDLEIDPQEKEMTAPLEIEALALLDVLLEIDLEIDPQEKEMTALLEIEILTLLDALLEISLLKEKIENHPLLKEIIMGHKTLLKRINQFYFILFFTTNFFLKKFLNSIITASKCLFFCFLNSLF